MHSHLGTQKIQPEHLSRQALIYVRQSSLAQVVKNIGSRARQYNLVQYAVELGWGEEQIEVIDQDQGLSGASAAERDGFQYVIAQVGLGRVGAVFSLEASRLSRSCSDWHRLIEICAFSGTLVIDEEGIYDPTRHNDSLLLGLKGTMGAAELHWLRSRLLGGKLEKARQGKLRWALPTGLVYDMAGEVMLDPDAEVRQAVKLVFGLFDELGTALAVVRHFGKQQLLFPTRHHGGGRDGELTWVRLSHRRVLDILRNPAYAGAYAYGRTKSRTVTLPEGVRVKKRKSQLDPDDWHTLLLDRHAGYLSWEQYRRNVGRLEDNRSKWGEGGRGAVREGSALLQGIGLCGRCGKRMRTKYMEDGATPIYECVGERSFGGGTCQQFRGDGVDRAVAQTFLEAIRPAELEVSMAALEQVEARARQIDEQWRLRLERAEYEADVARRRFVAVEPENRLVARNLEREWNEKLGEVEHLEREYAKWPKPTMLVASAEERERVLALAQDMPMIWQASTTTNVERKQLLRFLIKDVTLTKREKTIHIGIRWQTEAFTELEIPNPMQALCTSPVVVKRVRELAATHTDRQTAAVLNAENLTSQQGKVFTNEIVKSLRRRYKIPRGCPEGPRLCPSGRRGDGRYSTRAAAEALNVSESTIRSWCLSGRLESMQAVPGSPRWIKLTSEDIAALRKPIRRSLHSRR